MQVTDNELKEEKQSRTAELAHNSLNVNHNTMILDECRYICVIYNLVEKCQRWI